MAAHSPAVHPGELLSVAVAKDEEAKRAYAKKERAESRELAEHKALAPAASPAPKVLKETAASREAAPAGAKPTGIFARGEAHPPGDERLPRGSEEIVDSDEDAALAATPASIVVRHPTSAVSAVSSLKSEAGSPAVAEDSAAPSSVTEDVSARVDTHVSGEASDASENADEQDAVVKLHSKLSSRELAKAAVQPRVLPIYRDGHLIVPPPLRGTHAILVHQNEMADAAGLERIRNDKELHHLRATHRLVGLASSKSLHVNSKLPSLRRCARPWTAEFAEDLARAYYARFKEPLELNSAVRTIAYQIRLRRVNGNAAPARGETASPHLTGQAIDFGKRGMTLEEIAWMRAYLTPLMKEGAIDVEEEFQQACFHISVYRSYRRERLSRHRLDVARDQTDLRSGHRVDGAGADDQPRDDSGSVR